MEQRDGGNVVVVAGGAAVKGRWRCGVLWWRQGWFGGAGLGLGERGEEEWGEGCGLFGGGTVEVARGWGGSGGGCGGRRKVKGEGEREKGVRVGLWWRVVAGWWWFGPGGSGVLVVVEGGGKEVAVGGWGVFA
nr:ctenidin-3-like [Arachis hypogaea]